MNEFKSKLFIETDKAERFKNSYEGLVKKLKNHNYGSCECNLKMIPEVKKALDHICDIKLGK